MSEEPGSGVRMCHEQGKTAVCLSQDGQWLIEHESNGLSQDGQWLIEHESNGAIRRKPFVPALQTRT